MQLAELHLGQVWKQRDDKLMIINEPYRDGYVRFQMKSSGLIFVKSLGDFRRSSQCLLSSTTPCTQVIPQNYEEGQIYLAEDSGTTEQYIIVSGLRKKLRAVNVYDGLDISIGELETLNPILSKIPVNKNIDDYRVIALGKIWKVKSYDNTKMVAESDGVWKRLDWRVVGEATRWDSNELEQLAQMSLPQPEYGHLEDWEDFMRDCDYKDFVMFGGDDANRN